MSDERAPISGLIPAAPASDFRAAVAEMEALAFTHPFSVASEVAQFLYSLTKILRPRLVVEIGCFIGFSTIHFAQALKEGSGGRVIAIDLFNVELPPLTPVLSSQSINAAERSAAMSQRKMGKAERAHQPAAIDDGHAPLCPSYSREPPLTPTRSPQRVERGKTLSRQLAVAEHFRQRADLAEQITFIQAASDIALTKLGDLVPEGIDLLYIDGDHTLAGAFADFNGYSPLVRPGGYILLHDINPEACGWDGPHQLLRCLRAKRLIPRYLDQVNIATPDGFGLALLHKKNARPIRLALPKGERLRMAAQRHASAALGESVVYDALRAAYRRSCSSGVTPRWLSGKKGVEITIRDRRTGRPVPGAILECREPKAAVAQADAGGKLFFNAIPPGTYVVDVSAPGYETLRGAAVHLPLKPLFQKLLLELTPACQPAARHQQPMP